MRDVVIGFTSEYAGCWLVSLCQSSFRDEALNHRRAMARQGIRKSIGISKFYCAPQSLLCRPFPVVHDKFVGRSHLAIGCLNKANVAVLVRLSRSFRGIIDVFSLLKEPLESLHQICQQGNVFLL